jgi:anti-anti-sigma regulatory factor
MLKISILETPSHRRLVVEGKLIAPWSTELRRVWREATAELNGRELVIDVKGVTAIGEDGESALLEMMKEGARFRSSGVFTKWILKRLARKARTDERRITRAGEYLRYPGDRMR